MRRRHAAALVVVVVLGSPASAGEPGGRAIDCGAVSPLASDAFAPADAPWNRLEASAGLRIVMPDLLTFELSVQAVRGRNFRTAVPLGALSIDESSGDVTYTPFGKSSGDGSCVAGMR